MLLKCLLTKFDSKTVEYYHFHPAFGMSIETCKESLTQSKEPVTLFIKHH